MDDFEEGPTAGYSGPERRAPIGAAPGAGRAGDLEPPAGRTAPRQKAAKKRRGRSRTRELVEWVVVVGGALGIALLVNAFLFQPFRIPSNSMYPTLKVGDRVVVNKLSYKMHGVGRGDVVVFTRPTCTNPNVPTWANCTIINNVDDLIKRVVAVGGDQVAIKGGRVYVNGKALHESYLAHGTTTAVHPEAYCLFPGKITVPPGLVLVMGDNRGDSIDGRCFGPIPEGSIVGHAFVRIWPIARLGGL